MLKGHVDVYSPSLIAGWAVDLDAPERPVEVVIEINGEVVGRVLADQARPDVEAAVGRSGLFGFSAQIDLSQLTGNAFRISFSDTNDVLENGGRSFISYFNDIISGKNGWFFLRGQNEKVPFLELLLNDASDDFVKSISDSFKFRNRRVTEFYPLETYIVPDKSVIYPMYFPENYSISERRLVARVSEVCSCVNYPEVALRAFGAGLEIFYKNDSHLNDDGVLLFYSLMIHQIYTRYGIKFDKLPMAERRIDKFTGDLSREELNNAEVPHTVLRYSVSESLSYKNKLLNYGTVRYYRRPNSRGPRVYISGTSSALQLARLFSYSCSELLFHFNHDIDYELLSEFAPNIALIIVSERVVSRTLSDVGAKAGITYKQILERRW